MAGGLRPSALTRCGPTGTPGPVGVHEADLRFAVGRLAAVARSVHGPVHRSRVTAVKANSAGAESLSRRPQGQDWNVGAATQTRIAKEEVISLNSHGQF